MGAAAVYAIYELSRGLLAGDPPTAIRHATDVATLERSIHLFIERDLQRAAHSIPGLLGLFGGLYLTLHLTVTGGYLLWLYRHRPSAYAMVRTTLLIATLISLVIFALYPTAPPRIAGIGISDTVSGSALQPQPRTRQQRVQPVCRDAEHALRLRAHRRSQSGE